MITVNNIPVYPTVFPDGTSSLHFDLQGILSAPIVIDWRYESDAEMPVLYNIVHHLRDKAIENLNITLFMPYIPNARMDRVKHDDEIFTLKHFAAFINSLDFTRVISVDPHSDVAPALFDRFVSMNVVEYIINSLIPSETPESKNWLFCYPDEGSAKRYSSQINGDYVFGVKRRDWQTGKIESLELIGAEKVAGRDVLIIDDICSRGGTFIRAAEALKEAGANKVYLYVTHCEQNIFNGDILTSDLIEHVYTTNSLPRSEHEKISVIELVYQ